jgi:hypothetical protein
LFVCLFVCLFVFDSFFHFLFPLTRLSCWWHVSGLLVALVTQQAATLQALKAENVEQQTAQQAVIQAQQAKVQALENTLGKPTFLFSALFMNLFYFVRQEKLDQWV